MCPCTKNQNVYISTEAKKLFIKNPISYLNDIQQLTGYFHNYYWLCHLVTFVQKRWPSDKANVVKISCKLAIVCHSSGQKGLINYFLASVDNLCRICLLNKNDLGDSRHACSHLDIAEEPLLIYHTYLRISVYVYHTKFTHNKLVNSTILLTSKGYGNVLINILKTLPCIVTVLFSAIQ